MLELTSPYFGTLSYPEESVIEFPQGLPGFADQTRFVLVDQAFNRPLVFAQSLHRHDVCFITVPVLGVCPDYKLSVAAEDLRALGLAEDRQPVIGGEVWCLAIVSVRENKPPAVNLLSPIVVNWTRRCAMQVIPAESQYSYEHPLFESEAVESCS